MRRFWEVTAAKNASLTGHSSNSATVGSKLVGKQGSEEITR